MAIYFSFSDENGSYKRMRGNRFIRAHPFYVRATCVIDAAEWKFLESEYRALKQKYNIPAEREIKWSFARSLYKHRDNGKEIRENHPYYFLRDIKPECIQEFLKESLSLINQLNYCRAIFTVTCNSRCPAIAQPRLLRMHLQETMQRIQMDMSNDPANLCIFFVDPVSGENDKNLREAYSQLYRGGDLFMRYSHIKDSLNMEHSHHSVGIQMADFLAGAFVANLKGYPIGIEIYRETISNLIRRNPMGQPAGFGFRDVPRNNELRTEIAARCT